MSKRVLIKALTIWIVSAISFSVYAENYLLTVGSCPPWKKVGNSKENQTLQGSCKHDVDLISRVLKKRLNIKEKNHISLVDKNAVVYNLFQAIETFQKRVSPGDTLFFYQIAHGGVIEYNYKGYPVTDDVFAYYSVELPENYAQAIDSGLWLSPRSIRDKFANLIEEKNINILAIIESCHASADISTFQYSPLNPLKKKAKFAIILSSASNQVANYNEKGNGGLFTEVFSKAIKEAKKGSNLLDVYGKSYIKTHEMARISCEKSLKNKKTEGGYARMFQTVNQYVEYCTQKPDYYDPKGLISSIILK